MVKKEIHKCLKSKNCAAEQVKLEIGVKDGTPEADPQVRPGASNEWRYIVSVMKKTLPINRPPMPPQRPQPVAYPQQGHPLKAPITT